MKIIEPSVLSIKLMEFPQQLAFLNNNFSHIHFDVMDGHFVPNMAYGTSLLKTLKENSDLFVDVHIMAIKPQEIVDQYINLGADAITFHYEAFEDDKTRYDLIQYIKSRFILAGISIKPNTNVKALAPLLPYVDNVLIMSVEPGFSNQSFMEESLDKIAFLNNYRKQNNLNYTIQVDGGINDQTLYKCLTAGCDNFVVGSYLLDSDTEQRTLKLKNIIK